MPRTADAWLVATRKGRKSAMVRSDNILDGDKARAEEKTRSLEQKLTTSS